MFDWSSKGGIEAKEKGNNLNSFKFRDRNWCLGGIIVFQMETKHVGCVIAKWNYSFGKNWNGSGL